ncbi:MAG TPA: methyl-accepting chemotaxis protein [Candidatus Avamphibacillus sp.]|nr:methyl-accepting chemotaxis protein [Candidatus Avamphibacillus sp.]
MESLEITDSYHPLIEAFVKVGPLLQALVNDDITVGIYDTEKLIINYPAKSFSLNVNPGDPLVEGDIVTNAIQQNKNMIDSVPAELFGVDIIARAIPLHDENGSVVGGVGVGLSIENAQRLSDISSNLSSVVNDVTNTIQDMAQSVSELAENMTLVSEKATEVNKSTENIEKVSNVVKEIADQSNLLGLNAAIESARAGEHGKGFSVVADEIRRMATNSKKQVTEIQTITEQIKGVIMSLDEHIQEVNVESDSQSGAIEELTATMEEINSNVHTLADLAKENITIKE